VSAKQKNSKREQWVIKRMRESVAAGLCRAAAKLSFLTASRELPGSGARVSAGRVSIICAPHYLRASLSARLGGDRGFEFVF
jgi:hypothetical protein